MTKPKPLIIAPQQGRHYAMGGMSASFKADQAETGGRLSVSEWWLEPETEGPPLHTNPEDHLFYVLEGVVHVYLDNAWHAAGKGTYLFIPGGVQHGFENRSGERAGFMNINVPGGFEAEMPDIVQWFKENPPGPPQGQD